MNPAGNLSFYFGIGDTFGYQGHYNWRRRTQCDRIPVKTGSLQRSEQRKDERG